MAPKSWVSLVRTARVVATLIALTLAAAATDPAITGTRRTLMEGAIWLFVAAMAVDYVATVVRRWRAQGRAAGIRYVTSLAGIVAAASVLALPAGLLLGVDDGELWLFASVWVFKLLLSAQRLNRLQRVLAREAGTLGAVAALGGAMLFLAAVAVHVFEGGQDEAFNTIPEALWWAVNTVTGVGIEATPDTLGGRLVASFVMIAGLGVFGLAAGILASGFAEEVRREEFLGAWELVARVPFLKSLGPGAIADLAGTLRRWDVPENTVVVRRGARGECMYFVAEGAVEVQLPHGGVMLEEGSFFGEMALLEGGSGIRSATVRCTRPATLLVLDIADFRALIARHPALAQAVEEEAARRRAAAAAKEAAAA